MTPKDKAKLLIVKFKQHSMTYWHEVDGWDDKSNIESAKQCALICVDQIVQNSSLKLSDTFIAFWDRVKQEINKL